MPFVYIFTNKSFKYVKIGYTNRSPYIRARELSNSTGVPTPFKVYYYRKVKNGKLTESILHEKLKNYRVNKKREFFDISPQKAKKILDSIHGKNYIQFVLIAGGLTLLALMVLTFLNLGELK